MNLERLIISSLVFNEEFCNKTIAYLKDEYFESGASKFLFKSIFEFVNKYNNRPTKDALEIILQESSLNEHDFQQAYEIVESLDKSEEDTKWLVDTAENWAKERAVYNALCQSIAIANGESKEFDKSIIPTILSEALAVSFDSYLGHEYFEAAESHYDLMNSEVAKFPFAIPVLNSITKNGVAPKTLNIVLMGINLGKTTWLIDQAAHWMLNGKNVVYFTMEMSENAIRHRVDTRVMDITFDELEGLSRDRFLSRIGQIRQRTAGKLYIKEYPTSSVHVGHLRHHLRELKLKHGVVPDLIIVDYLTIMQSQRLASSNMGNTNTYFTAVAEELRGLGVEYEVPVWTAAQFNRGGQNSQGKKYEMSDIAAAIGIAATADLMLAGSQDEQLEQMGKILMTVMKNRYNNKSKLKNFLLGLDNERQKFFSVDDSEQLHVNKDTSIREKLTAKNDGDDDETMTNNIMEVISGGRKSRSDNFEGWNV